MHIEAGAVALFEWRCQIIHGALIIFVGRGAISRGNNKGLRGIYLLTFVVGCLTLSCLINLLIKYLLAFGKCARLIKL